MLFQLSISKGLKASVINTPGRYQIKNFVDEDDCVLLANLAQVASPSKTLGVRLVTWLSLPLEKYFYFFG